MKGRIMWYLSWALGVGIALVFSIAYVMWLEATCFCNIELEKEKEAN